MNKTLWIILLVVCTCIAFAAGMTLGRKREPQYIVREVPPNAPQNEPQRDRVPLLLATQAELRNALAEKEDEIRELEAELVEVRESLPIQVTPEDLEGLKKTVEFREWRERVMNISRKSKPLYEKILQRKDRVARAEGLDELAALLQGDDAEQLLIGLWTLSRVYDLNFDKGRFKPWVLAALSHEDSEVRKAATASLSAVCSEGERLEIMPSLTDDPSPEIRRIVARHASGWMRADNPDERFVSAIRSFIEDQDKEVRQLARDALGGHPEYAQEMEKLAIELSKEPVYADEMLDWLVDRKTITREISQHVVATLEARGDNALYRVVDMTHRQVTDEAKPILLDVLVRTVRDGFRGATRRYALQAIQRMGDVNVLPELERISLSVDAEGIEEQLAETIESLRKEADQQSQPGQP